MQTLSVYMIRYNHFSCWNREPVILFGFNWFSTKNKRKSTPYCVKCILSRESEELISMQNASTQRVCSTESVARNLYPSDSLKCVSQTNLNEKLSKYKTSGTLRLGTGRSSNTKRTGITLPQLYSDTRISESILPWIQQWSHNICGDEMNTLPCKLLTTRPTFSTEHALLERA